MNSQLTGKQKFWILLSAYFQFLFLFSFVFEIDSADVAWVWVIVYPIMASGLLGFFALFVKFLLWFTL